MPCRHRAVAARHFASWLLLSLLYWVASTSQLLAQAKDAPQAPNNERAAPVTQKIDISPVAGDDEIRKRLQDILEATGWFSGSQVVVRQGVVFLSGQARTDELKQWATDLAHNMQGVVAVANRMEVIRPSIWNFAGAQEGMAELRHDLIRALPFMVLGLGVLGLSVAGSWLSLKSARAFFKKRVRSRLLRGVFAWAVAALVLFAGLYIVLRVSGLTQLALTVVGGTGLIGLVLGIAFRDITENFLASIFLSVQEPFQNGDLIDVAGETGYVRQLNVRSTVLMTLDGNIVEIPNAAMYKAVLRNFTTNPNRREHFVVGIGYDNAIDQAQEVALNVLAGHPAVLEEPEPLVLADNLGKATVDLKVYFWLDGSKHSAIKVRSSIIRLIKRAFQQHEISMPDEAREVVFPDGVPFTLVEGAKTAEASLPKQPSLPDSDECVSTEAEAGLSSEAGVLEEQTRRARPVNSEDNLLNDTATSDTARLHPKAS